MKQIFLGIVLGLLVLAGVGVGWAANDTTSSTWLLDTANTTTNVTDQNLDVAWIIWTNITSDGDDLIVQDGNGDNIVKLKGKSGVDMIVPYVGRIRGFRLHTLDSGNVQVRLR